MRPQLSLAGARSRPRPHPCRLAGPGRQISQLLRQGLRSWIIAGLLLTKARSAGHISTPHLCRAGPCNAWRQRTIRTTASFLAKLTSLGAVHHDGSSASYQQMTTTQLLACSRQPAHPRARRCLPAPALSQHQCDASTVVADVTHECIGGEAPSGLTQPRPARSTAHNRGRRGNRRLRSRQGVGQPSPSQ